MKHLTYKTKASIAALAFLVIASGCSKSPSEPQEKEHALNISIGASPQSIDPHVVTGTPGMKVLDAICEPLVGINGKTFSVEPAAAHSWDISEDGLEYTFYLRNNGLWSNGSPVTAHDFTYAWKRALLPAVGWQQAPEYYALAGAEAYHKGEQTDFSQVGVKAIDDYTLKFQLAKPDALFIKGLSAAGTCPILGSALEKHGAIDDVTTRWTDAGNYVNNGPFYLTKWEINKILVAEKNPHYWDTENVKLEKIYFHPIETEASEERAFRAGQIQMAHGGRIPAEKIATYQEKAPEKLRLVKAYATYFYLFNTTKAPFDNPLVRNALSLAVNREAIVKNITKAGEKPAGALSLLDGNYKPELTLHTHNVQRARELLAQAGYPQGNGFPSVTLIYNTADMHRKVALAIQQMWKKELGIDVQLENQEWKIFLNTRQNLHFDIARAGSISGLADPQDFLGSYITGHGMNDTGWANPEYDALIEKARQQTSEEKRFELLGQAEALLLQEAPLIPIYYYSHSYLIAPEVKGMEYNAIDRIPYKNIYIEQAAEK